MNSIPWYKSQVQVSALIAGVLQAAVLLGLSTPLTEDEVGKLVEVIMQLIAAGSTLWTLISRARSKIQPLTLRETK